MHLLRISKHRSAIISRMALSLIALSFIGTFVVADVEAAGVRDRTVLTRGNTLGEWGARWWQWIMSIPTDSNPAFDETGENCASGQSGPVWFLAGRFGTDPVERSCTVPKGKMILAPIITWAHGAAVFDCEPTVPGTLCNIAALRAAQEEAMGTTALMFKVDGQALALPRLRATLATTPVFEITLPDGNIITTLGGSDMPAGTYTPHVGVGYWVMLRPLPPGEHTLEFQAETLSGPAAGMGAYVTYHLTITE